MLCALLTLLAAAPQTAVPQTAVPQTAVVVSFPGHAPQEAEASRRVVATLAGSAEPAGRAAVAKCGGDLTCVGKLARELGVDALVTVQLSQVADVTVGQFDAVSPSGARLAAGDFTATGSRWAEALDAALLPFAKTVFEKLRELAPAQAPADAPVVPAPVAERAPPPAPEPAVTTVTQPEGKPVARWLPAVGGVVLLGAGAALEGMSLSIAARLQQERFPDAQAATRLAASGADFQTAGWALLIGGVVVVAAGVVVALLWPEPSR